MYLIYVPPYLLARWTSLPFTRARPSSQNPPPKYTKMVCFNGDRK